MSQPPRNPTNWDEYQYGTSHRDSVSSGGGRSVQFEDEVHRTRDSSTSGYQDVHDDERHDGDVSGRLTRRRSSVAMRLNALAQVGGVNSIANFARSWQRAAAFHEVAPRRPSFLLASDDDAHEDDVTEQHRYARTDVEHAPTERTSLLRQHFEASSVNEVAIQDETDDEQDSVTPEAADQSEAKKYRPESDPTTPRPLQANEMDKNRLGSELSSMREIQPVLSTASHLIAELAGSYGTSYGTLRSTRPESSMVHAGQMWRQQQQDLTARADSEREPLIVKEVEQDGKIVLTVAGQSTLPQTVFNATNVLIGVGLLSLPLGIKYAGLICGMGFLFFSALITAYTANLLARCLDVDVSLITFADLAFITYGPKARIVTGILFMLELLAANIALVVLFADTLNILIPSVGVLEWKILCGVLLVPLNFVPLRFLSFSSVLGIFSCFCIVMIVFIDGFIKPESPGSLRQPAKTYLFPENWLTLPLSFGIIMSPFGGHSVFPSIYRDMRHPHKYAKGVKIAFSFTYLLDAATAMAGILMFGDAVRDEITSNIIGAPGYPKILSILVTVFIAIIPLTKLPLNARPIVSTIEVFAGLDIRAVSDSPSLMGLSGQTRGILKVVVRVVVIIIFVIFAIIFPAFDSIMAFMGSALCFTICVILPLFFHMKLFGDRIGNTERIINYFLIGVSSVLAIVGTVFAFLPKSLIGAERGLQHNYFDI